MFVLIYIYIFYFGASGKRTLTFRSIIKVYTHSATVSYNTAKSSQAESDDTASKCELLLLQLTGGTANYLQ